MLTTKKLMSVTKFKPVINRRGKIDLWFYLAKVLSIFSWLSFLFALVMSFYAAPEQSYGVIRYYNIEIRQFWLTPLTGYLYITIWLSAVGSYTSLLIDKYRSRRKSDNPFYHLQFLLAINLIWLLIILQSSLKV